MTRKICDTCKHFGGERVKMGATSVGSCRLDGPAASSQAIPGRNEWLGQWPWVRIDDWCGRHSDDADRAKMATQVAVGKPKIE